MRLRLKPANFALLLICSTSIALSAPTLTERSLVLAQSTATPDQKAEADKLYKQGEDQLNQGQLSAALESLQKALEIYRSLQDRKQEGHTLRVIGAVYFSQKDYPKMIEFQQQALEVARTIQDADLEARALSNIGLAYASLKQLDKARSYYEQSLAASTRARNFRMIAITVGNLTGVSKDARGYAQARSVLQSALNLKPESIDRARLLFSLGNAYFSEAINGTEPLTLQRIQREKVSPSPLYSRAVTIYQQALTIMQVVSDPLLKADILSQMGGAYSKMGKHSDSIESLKGSLALYKQAANRPNQLSNSIRLMLSYAELASSAEEDEDYPTALKALEQEIALVPEALALAKALNRPEDEKKILSYQAIAHYDATQIYLELQDLPRAKEQADRAWVVAKQSGDSRTEKNALSALGSYYNDIGDNIQLLEVKKRVLEIARLNPNPYEEAFALSSLANAVSNVGDPQKALQLLQEATAKATTITPENLPAYATPEFVVRLKRDIAMNFAVIHSSRGDRDQYLAFAQQALDLSRQMRDRKEQFTFLLWAANAYSKRQEYGSAQQVLQQALALTKTLNQPDLEVQALLNLSGLAKDQGNSHHALDFAQQALAIVQRHKPKQSIHYDWVNLEVTALNALSSAYRVQGNEAKSLEVLQQAVDASQQLADPNAQQGMMNILGTHYLVLGDYAKASALFQQVLELAQTQQNFIHLQGALSYLSQVAFAQQKPQQAIEFAQQGLAISRQKQYLNGELSNMLALSQGYGELGDDSKAMAMAQALLDLARRMGVSDYQRGALQTLGDLHRRFGRWDQAQASYETALANGSRSAKTYAGLAQVYVQRKQPTVAITFYKQAINNIENYRRNLRGLSTDLQLAYLQSTLDFGGVKTADIYRQLAELLLSKGRILEAQQVLELLKVQELKDFDQTTRARITSGKIELDPTERIIVEKYGSFIAFGQKLRECQESKPKCADHDRLIQLRIDAGAEYDRAVKTFETAIKAREQEDKDNFLNPENDLDAAARTIIEARSNTALIYSLITDNKLWLIVASKGEALRQFEVTVPQQELNGTVLKFRQLMEQCETRPCTAEDKAALNAVSQQLYIWLFPKPLQEELQRGKIKHLVFAQDRMTRYIPMAALFDGQQYLIENFTVSTIVSAGLTRVQRPNFTTQTTSVLAAGLSNPAPPDYRALKNVPIELATIVRDPAASTKGIFPGLQLLNEKFDFFSLQKHLYGHTILHIATHGAFVREQADASYILLGNGKKLPISEIKTLNDLGKIHLVVLSACQTALADRNANGVEIANVSYSFLDRGVQSVIASLWQVNDFSTSLFMQEFYSRLAKGNITKAEAMRQVQNEFLKGKVTTKDLLTRSPWARPLLPPEVQQAVNTSADFSHPYYWAPFILIGNSQ